jgi:hypothetical protein
MKIATMTMWAAMAGAFSQSDAAAQTEDQSVTVCVEKGAGFGVLPLAQQIASKMFAEAGVTVDWRRGVAGCPAQGILISLSDRAPADVPSDAMAYALAYEGSHIVIFFDRLQRRVQAAQISALLAHVLVHEVTHILQGISRHSGQGIMKAHWDGPDYQVMRFKPLSFTAEDIELIHRGLAERAVRAASRRAADTEAAPAATQ